jgi:hypothetical protein
MNLVLHQFRKEVRYLLPRWAPWLVLLMVLLMVELEWLLPMGLRRGEGDLYFIQGLRWSVRGLALWLAISSVPEDLPGNPSRFLAARPLPMRSYLGARVLTFLLLVAAPLAVWEALYLGFSGRPALEVMLGAAEAGVVAVIAYGWVVPFGFVWQGSTQRWLGLGVMGFAAYVSEDGRARLSHFTWDILMVGRCGGALASFPPAHDLPILALAAMATLALWAVAWRHLKLEWTLRSRLRGGCLIGAIAGWWAGSYHPLPLPLNGAKAQAEVDALAATLSPTVEAEMDLQPMRSINDSGTKVAISHLTVHSTDVPNISLHWRSRGSEATWLGESRPGASHLMPAAAYASNWSLHIKEAPRTVAALFPKGTQLRWHERTFYGEYIRDVLRAPESWVQDAPGKPTLRGTLEACWVRWTLGGEMPLVKGAKLELEDSRWEILELLPHTLEKGSPQQGALAVRLRVEHRENQRRAEPWSWQGRLVPMIHAPGRGVVWVSQSQMESRNSGTMVFGPTAERGEGTGWVRTHLVLSWPAVVEPRAGVMPDQMAELRLAVVRREFMGTSLLNYDLRDVTVTKNTSLLQAQESMQDEDKVAARIAGLPDLPEGAGEKQAAELIAAVLESVPEGGAGKVQAVEKLRPVARRYPGLLLKLDVWGDWKNVVRELTKEFGEDQRDAMIDRLPDAPWLASVIIKRGWTQEARRMADKLLAAPSIATGTADLFWEWKDPAQLPGLLRHLKRSANYERFQELDKFPGAEPGLQECASFWMAQTDPIVEKWVSGQEDALLASLACGNSEALSILLGLSRNMTVAERRKADKWVTELLMPLFGWSGKKSGEFLELLAGSKPEDFRFEAAQRRWVRLKSD